MKISYDLRFVLPNHNHKLQMKPLFVCTYLSGNVQHQFVGDSTGPKLSGAANICMPMSLVLASELIFRNIIVLFFHYAGRLWSCQCDALSFNLFECCINNCAAGTKGRLDLISVFLLIILTGIEIPLKVKRFKLLIEGAADLDDRKVFHRFPLVPTLFWILVK